MRSGWSGSRCRAVELDGVRGVNQNTGRATSILGLRWGLQMRESYATAQAVRDATAGLLLLLKVTHSDADWIP